MRKLLNGIKTEIVVVSVVCVLAVIVSVFAAGCSVFDGNAVETAQRSSQAADIALADGKAYWQERYNDAVARGDTDAAEKAGKAVDFYAVLETEKAATDAEVQDVLGRVTNEDGTINPEKAATEAAATLLPYPWSLIATAAIPFGGLVVREIQNYRKVKDANTAVQKSIRQSEEIIAAVDAAKMADPRITEGFRSDAVQFVMSSAMSPETYEFVEARRNS